MLVSLGFEFRKKKRPCRFFELTFENTKFHLHIKKHMIVGFHLIVFLVHEYFMPDWQRHVHYITREIVAVLLEALVQAEN